MTKPIQFRLSKEEYEKLKKISKNLGYVYGGQGQPSGLLKAIVNEEIKIIKTYP